MTLRGAGGSLLPDMVMILRPTGAGGSGGASRITSGSGVSGRAGCCRMISGGAGDGIILASCDIMISPGAGGVGGRK